MPIRSIDYCCRVFVCLLYLEIQTGSNFTEVSEVSLCFHSCLSSTLMSMLVNHCCSPLLPFHTQRLSIVHETVPSRHHSVFHIIWACDSFAKSQANGYYFRSLWFLLSCLDTSYDSLMN